VPKQELFIACLDDIVKEFSMKLSNSRWSKVEPNLRRWWRLLVTVEASVRHSTRVQYRGLPCYLQGRSGCTVEGDGSRKSSWLEGGMLASVKWPGEEC